MKKSHSLLSFVLAGLFAMCVETRGEDPVPPKPPGPTKLPAAPAAPAASTSEPTAPAGGKSRAAEFMHMLKEKLGVTDEQLEKMKREFTGRQSEDMASVLARLQAMKASK